MAVDVTLFAVMTMGFVALTLFLGWYGFKNTKSNDEYLLGRSKARPLIIGLSYGATFLSTAAIVGFGGQAAQYGMFMIWLVVLNLFFGLIVTFLVFGKRTRRIGKELGAFTFADFLGKRFKSPGIRTLASVIILVGMPLYCAAVLLGSVNFIDVTIPGLDRSIIIIGFSLIVGIYVAYGGVIAVMYNDAVQAAIMFAGMAVILIVTYWTLGTGANADLTGLWGNLMPGNSYLEELAADGMNGWTSAPDFLSKIWLIVVTTFMLGVGIGALSQPQLVVRFMSAKDDKTLNKSLIIGGIFMIGIVGVAYTVGALSNVFFFNEHGMGSVDWIRTIGDGNIDKIIPTFLNEMFAGIAFGDVFLIVFILAILCASISTMSSLFHAMGTSVGYDLKNVIEDKKKKEHVDSKSIRLSRISTLIMIVVVIVVAYLMPVNIIARATSIFMGLTAATLLPAYAHSLYSKNPNLLAAKCSIIVGMISWALWAFFMNGAISTMAGTPLLVDKTSLLTVVDPLIIALPFSIAALILGLLLKPKKAEGAELDTE